MPPLSSASVVLDVGCSTGALGARIQSETGAVVIGIEMDPTLAADAERRLARVICDDALHGLARLRREQVAFDLVVFADVLEHMTDPWTAVNDAISIMPHGGWLIASIPNVAHYSTHIALIRGTWPSRDRGIHDRSHLRFFARRDLHALFDRPGRTSMETLSSVFRFTEQPRRFNRYAKYVGRAWPNGFTYQYVVRVRVNPRA